MNSIFVEVTFSQPCIHLMLPKQFQSQPQLFHMFFLILRINKNAIKKNKNKPVKIHVETTIHETHECSWCIGETKRHHHKFTVPIPCPKGCLVDFVSLDPHLMVTDLKSIFENTFPLLI